MAAVMTAEADGLALFKASQNPEVLDAQTISEARSRIANFCDFDYRPVRVMLHGEPAIFFLAKSSQPNDIIFGRHFKVVGTKVFASTKTCFNAGTPVAGTIGAYVTHILSPAPSEFHVYLSLVHKEPLYIGTSAGFWVADKGKLKFLEKPKN